MTDIPTSRAIAVFQKGLAKTIVLSSLLEQALQGNLRSQNVGGDGRQLEVPERVVDARQGGSGIALPSSLNEECANVLTDDTTCATWP